MNPQPSEAIISLTNRCDARCRMCNIWRLERDELLEAEDYRNLPSTLQNINITGGEPLLRGDILEVLHAIKETGDNPRIIVATNGFRTNQTIKIVEAARNFIPKFGVAVSIDGLQQHHNYMRGVPNAFTRATETLRSLHEIGIKDIRIGFTATTENISQLPLVHKLAQGLGVQFTATVAQNSDFYYATTSNNQIPINDVKEYFGYLIDCNLRSNVIKNWFRAYFEFGVVHFVQYGRRMTTCTAASDFFYLSPKGDVYPCLTLPHIIGNIRNEKFDVLWRDHKAKQARNVVQTCQACWMVCTARTAIKQSPMRVIGWIAKNKIFHHAD